MKSASRRYFIMGGMATAALATAAAWPVYRSFGATPERPISSPNCQNGVFHNLPDDYIYKDLAKETEHKGGWLKFFLSRRDDRYPPAPVPSVKTDIKSLKDGEFVWFGHSSFLIKLAGKFICIDPVLSSHASPLPFIIPAWPGSEPYAAEDFPRLDYLCISHDHWDHLDYATVSRLKFRHLLCGKGTGAHFRYWGLGSPHEMDWFEESGNNDLKFIFTPSRHFSGRWLDRNKSLWGGFIMDAGSGGKAYFTGDGGYGNHFRDIGRKYGPFDIVFPDSGQYNRGWDQVHMFPEQSVQAAIDTKSRRACPAHIGKFTLAWHPHDEPRKRFELYADKTGQAAIFPIIGEKCGL